MNTLHRPILATLLLLPGGCSFQRTPTFPPATIFYATNRVDIDSNEWTDQNIHGVLRDVDATVYHASDVTRPPREPVHASLPPDTFREILVDALRTKTQVIVFVHGFNVAFDTAARTAAEIHSGLLMEAHEHQTATPDDVMTILYSWPSKGSRPGEVTGVRYYVADEDRAYASVEAMKQFLTELAECRQRAGAATKARLHLIAHSMGCRLVTLALQEFVYDHPQWRTEPPPAGTIPPLFDNVVFVAADMDATRFRRDFARIRQTRLAGNYTLYASSRDRALQASRRVHDNPRAGLAGDDLLVLPGLVTIDASPAPTTFLGHFYYTDSPAVRHDLHGLLFRGQPPAERDLARIEADDGEYYLLVPD